MEQSIIDKGPSLKRTLHKSKKYSLISLMYIPNIALTKSSLYISASPMVYLSMYRSDGTTPTTLDEYKSLGICITPGNLIEICDCIDKASKWFSDKDMIDLFVRVSEDNHTIIFNSKYDNLSSTYNGFTNSIKLAPTVFTDDNTQYEGVVMYFNKLENYITLSVLELRRLNNLINSINLTNEGILLLSAYETARRLGNINQYDPKNN